MAARLDEWLQIGRQTGLAVGQAVAGDLAFVFGQRQPWAGMARMSWRSAPIPRGAKRRGCAAAAGTWMVGAERLGQPDDGVHCGTPPSRSRCCLARSRLAACSRCGARGAGERPMSGRVGEVAAAWASGALTLDAACHVVVQRSLAQQTAQATAPWRRLAPAPPCGRGGVRALLTAARDRRRERSFGGDGGRPRRRRFAVLGVIAEARGWAFTRLDLVTASTAPAWIRSGPRCWRLDGSPRPRRAC